MDPDTCLSEIRSIVQHVDDPDEPDTVEDRFERLVQLVDGLDSWMSLGGYPPRPWQPDIRQRTRGDQRSAKQSSPGSLGAGANPLNGCRVR